MVLRRQTLSSVETLHSSVVLRQGLSLCNPSYLGTGFVDQAGLRLTEILPSVGIKDMHHHAIS